MGVYIYNGPIVLPKEKDTFSINLSIDGTAWEYGKKVTSWSNVRSNKSWLSISYASSTYDDYDKWAYSFNIETLSNNTSVDERSATCYADYTLEDGTTGSISFPIYQLGNSGILCDSENPMTFSANDYQNAFSPVITYLKAKTDANIDSVYVNGDWDVYATSGGFDGTNFHIEYDVSPKYYNVDAEDYRGNLMFSYINPETSVRNDYFLYLVQRGCQYPFGIGYTNGEDIPYEGVGINKRKRIRNISFKGQKILLNCFYPYVQEGEIVVKFNDGGGIASMTTGGGMIDNDIAEEQYTIIFSESFETSARSVSLSVEYVSMDGEKHTDYVQLIQDASDGSNLQKSVTCSVDTIKVQADGKPELSSGSKIRVRYVGNIYWTAPTYPEWIHMGQPVLIEGEGTNNKLYEWPVTYDINTTGEVRTATIVFSADDSNGNTWQDSIEVTQAKVIKEDIVVPDIPVEGDEYIGPIWKDVVYNFGGVDVVEYGVYITTHSRIGDTAIDVDTMVFKGVSCKRPDSDNNVININRICQNYLDTPLLSETQTGSVAGYNVFKLKSGDGNVVYKTYRFVNDWSYGEFNTGLLSHPILNDHNTVVRNQLLPFTVFGAAETVGISYGIRYMDGFVDEYDRPIEDWESTKYVKNGVETELFPYSGRTDGAVSYYIGDKVYDIVDDCTVDYVLYYVNPWGGYDWFPIKGKVTEKDTITQYSFRQNYNNNTWEFGKRRYCGEITKKYTLNTHWLKEDESMRMWYLLQSNVVYLHNLREDEIYPIVITATEQEHKKRTKKSSRISYQIDCELSQTRMRI